MTIDIRADVTCSLGRVISAQISDDYIQGSGLIKTRGSCEIAGVISPRTGTPVTFQYTKKGLTRTIPRKLRVLSSFADPFRRKTNVELGCKLTYLEDLQEPVNWDVFDDPENEEEDPEDEIPVFQIQASSVAYQCLSKLGIAASSMPLNNKFSVETFDFSGGYVDILSNLLVSESYAGYLDTNEVLRIFPLYYSGGSGPVIDASKIIDISQINSGQLPGDAVTVSYSSLKLKNSSEEGTELLTEEEIRGVSVIDQTTFGYRDTPSDLPPNPGGSENVDISEISIGYKLEDLGGGDPGPLQFQTYTTIQTKTESSTFSGRNVTNDQGNRETKYLLTYRKVEETKSDVLIAGGFVTDRLRYGSSWGGGTVGGTTTETFEYNNRGEEVRSVLTRVESRLFGAGNISLPTAFVNKESQSVTFVEVPSGEYIAEKIVKISEYFRVYSERNGTTTISTTTKVTTKKYGPWIETIQGQQTLARMQEAKLSAGDVGEFIASALSGLYLISTSIDISAGATTSQEAPSERSNMLASNREGSQTSQVSGINSEQEDEGGDEDVDPNNGFSIESKSQLELAAGFSGGSRVIELSMPYASDDRFIRFGFGENLTYSSFSSDAPSKARLFGRTQNRMLLGNRNGMNIQMEPEYMPSAPFSPFYVVADGIAGMYLTNGTSWTIDSNGIIASTDGMYWGTAGRTS